MLKCYLMMMVSKIGQSSKLKLHHITLNYVVWTLMWLHCVNINWYLRYQLMLTQWSHIKDTILPMNPSSLTYVFDTSFFFRTTFFSVPLSDDCCCFFAFFGDCCFSSLTGDFCFGGGLGSRGAGGGLGGMGSSSISRIVISNNYM